MVEPRLSGGEPDGRRTCSICPSHDDHRRNSRATEVIRGVAIHFAVVTTQISK